jgi:WD40 repeat protein
VLEGHTDLVRTVEFNRRWIVSGSYDGTIRLWDIRAKRAFSELRNHTGRVFKLQFDHSTIASCSQDGRIAIYDFSRTAGVNGNYMQIDNRYF